MYTGMTSPFSLTFDYECVTLTYQHLSGDINEISNHQMQICISYTLSNTSPPHKKHMTAAQMK
jgi:hypothetical protein